MAALPDSISWLKIGLASTSIVVAGLTVLRRCRLRGSALMDFWKAGESLLPASQTFFLSRGFRRDLCLRCVPEGSGCLP